MRTLTFVLSLLAVGASAFAVVTTVALSHDVREGRERGAGDGTLEARLSALEQALAAREREAGRPAALGAASTPADAARTGAALPASAPGTTLAGAAHPATPAELERRLADVEKRLHERETSPVPLPAQVAAEGAVKEGPVFLNSIDEAAKHLDLTASQRAEFDRAVEEAKREVDVIRTTPDDTGATWEKLEKDVMKFENNSFTIDPSKLAALREKVMPGRNESFGGAMRRVREEAMRRMKAALSPAQQEKFAGAATDGLVPGSGNGDLFGLGNVSFGFSTTPDATPAMN